MINHYYVNTDSKNETLADYASDHLILSWKFLKKLTVITIDPKIQIVKKKRERSIHCSPISASTKSVGCGTILFGLSFSDIHVPSSYCFTLLLYPYILPLSFYFFCLLGITIVYVGITIVWYSTRRQSITRRQKK